MPFGEIYDLNETYRSTIEQLGPEMWDCNGLSTNEPSGRFYKKLTLSHGAFFSGWVLLVLLYVSLVGYARLGFLSPQDSELSGE